MSPRATSAAIAVGLPLAALAGACGEGRGPAGEVGSLPAFELGPVEWSGPPGSGEPHLFGTEDGRALLSWQEEAEDAAPRLRLAERGDGGWSEPRTVASRPEFFVNWADFPSVTELADGTLLVHWLEKTADAPYAYHVHLSLSSDGGATWSDPVVPHGDRSPTEHGFVSVVPWRDGAALVWLDGREMAAAADGHGGAGAEAGQPEEAGSGAMTLRGSTISSAGVLGEEALLDERTCECCATALARAGGGLVAAYRDRGPEEVRDIYAVRYRPEDGGGAGAWTTPRRVHADGWRIPGCPVNGPQLAAEGDRVAVAWFTAPEGEPRVLVAFSADGGASWGAPVRVDEGTPLGRVDLALLPDGSAAVAWIGAAPAGGSDGAGTSEARVHLRRVDAEGRLGPAAVVSSTSAARASGFPRLARVGQEVLVAWTLPGPEGGIRVRSAR